MTVLLLAALALVLWCVVPLPVAIAVGRAFRAGEQESDAASPVREFDTAV
jgi:hypothetical protein